MSEASIVCTCGMTLKAAGARPGRVGKCPKCGALLRVADAVVPPKPVEQPPPPFEEIAPPDAYVGSRSSKASAARRKTQLTAADVNHGPLRPPRKLETWFHQSLAYPLWAWSSVAILVFMPPLLALVSSPLPFLFGIMTGGSPFTIAGLVMFLPMGLGGLFVWGYLLVYMTNVLTSSSLGDPLPPRTPNFQSDDVFRLLFRWFCALFAGLIVGFVPAVAYWIDCGELDWSDGIILFSLFVLGIAYAQMALLAALLHDDPWAANPITVLRALHRVGSDYASIGILAAAWVLLIAGLFTLVLKVKHPLAHLCLMWLFWVIFLYSALVLLRCQGLFSRRHNVVLNWFPDRPMWGR